MSTGALAGLVLLFFSAYLLGSLSGSLLLGRVFGLDIRQSGSGNAGGTNALRARGWRFALPVVLIDVGKGVLATAFLPLLWPQAQPTAAAVAAGCGFAALMGHIYPVFFGFRGGKGAATFVGGLLGFAPLIAAGLVAAWLVCLILTGFVGLSTMFASLATVGFSIWLVPDAEGPWVLSFCAACAVAVVLAHHSNLRRMVAGQEPQMRRVMVFRRWR
ncbi:MAG: glycerol-3-phosphate 1-O-acyltransferase PlsY [Lysobacterales bacterium]